jgi:hypothetical protein
MSDEELIKLLRLGFGNPILAADRIGDLLKFSSYWHNRAETAEADFERIISEWAEVSQKNYQRAKSAEAKLAKAVKCLRWYADHCTPKYANAVLAKLEGKE